MARSTLAKAFGLSGDPLSDTTWQPLPRSMLKLLVEIADVEKRLEAQRAAPKACGDPASPAPCNDPLPAPERTHVRP
jgi:hypothetical protein